MSRARSQSRHQHGDSWATANSTRQGLHRCQDRSTWATFPSLHHLLLPTRSLPSTRSSLPSYLQHHSLHHNFTSRRSPDTVTFDSRSVFFASSSLDPRSLPPLLVVCTTPCPRRETREPSSFQICTSPSPGPDRTPVSQPSIDVHLSFIEQHRAFRQDTEWPLDKDTTPPSSRHAAEEPVAGPRNSSYQTLFREASPRTLPFLLSPSLMY